MATTNINVRSYVDLNCLVCEINDKSDPNARPPFEGKQRHDKHKCRTETISLTEWNWRFETAKDILCNGTGYPGDEEAESYYGGGGGIGEEFL